MNYERDLSTTDEYFMTAVQIFDCCGVESSGALRVDDLMDKFAPIVKTNKADFSFLNALMDPEQCNPEINVTKLANALHKYSESQKTKMDLDESFNLKGGQAPQDSDSGISSDGLQLLEELQGELKEKEHLAHQLRTQLDFTDKQHEEALSALTAERDTLMKHLNMVREENNSLSNIRREYDETSERLSTAESSLAAALIELDQLRRRNQQHTDARAGLQSDIETLQELLSQSRAECHRINEMYASRQAALIEQNEALKADHAELTARLHDQEDYMQEIIKEKVLVEMELKDLLNKSNQTHLRLDRSIDVSYTEDQMLTALDTLNADSRFGNDHRLLDEESFNTALKEDQGRPTNLSLFDEIRYSFYNKSIHFDKDVLDRSTTNSIVAWTQTDEGFNDIQTYGSSDKADSSLASIKAYLETNTVETQTEQMKSSVNSSVETQTDFKPCPVQNKVDNDKVSIETQTFEVLDKVHSVTQTIGIVANVKKNILRTPKKFRRATETQTEFLDLTLVKCLECANTEKYTAKLERDVKYSNLVLSELQVEIAKYEDNLDFLQKLIDEGKDKNDRLSSYVEDLNKKIGLLENAVDTQRAMLDAVMHPEVYCIDCQTEFEQASVSTQVDASCAECEKRNSVVSHRTLRKFFWEPLKCLFQVFAVICFVCALLMLCGVVSRGGDCRASPWKWLHAQELMDLLLRIEYTAEVPM